jgi:hypothetical protein
LLLVEEELADVAFAREFPVCAGEREYAQIAPVTRLGECDFAILHLWFEIKYVPCFPIDYNSS